MGCVVHVNRHGFLTFRVYSQGREFWEGIGLPDTAANRRLAEAQAVIISDDISRGRFEYLRWFPGGNKAHLFGVAAAGQRLTLRQYYGRWIENKIPPLVKRSAHRNYKAHFVNHLLPLLGDRFLDTLAVGNIRDLLTELVERKKLSVKSAKNILNASLRAVLRDAVADGYLSRSPFEDLPANFWPQSVRPDPDPFCEAERDEITDYLFSKFSRKWMAGAVFCYAQFWAGTRPSEMTARRWRDLDQRSGRLSITSSRTEGEEGAPKTAGSRRSIDLLPRVLEYVLALKPLRAQPEDYIFTDQRGNPINHWKFGEQHFQGALTALEIRHRDFYCTRHTFISVMLAHGENLKQLADYVGNSPYMISTRYAKWLGGAGSFGRAASAAAGVELKRLRQG